MSGDGSNKLRLVNEYSYKEILEAYLDCRKRKRSTVSCMTYERNFERNLLHLLKEINSETYKISRTRVFVVFRPKVREVWAALFRDRIVHHLLCRDLEPYFIRRFIPDTYACIKERGTLAASLRAEHFAKSITQNWHYPAWSMKLDIASFFVSINRSILWEVLNQHLDETTLTGRLTKQVVFHDPTINPIVITGTDFSVVPVHKQLMNCKKGYGLPIGNLTSQFFANIFLDALDQYVKHILKVKYYIRYMDDMLLMSKDREQLEDWRDKIDAWLRENREIHLHPNKTLILPLSAGFDFVGTNIKPFRKTPRRMTITSFKQGVQNFYAHPLEPERLDSLNSYLGVLRQCNTLGFRNRLCSKLALSGILDYDKQCTKLFYL